MKLLSAFSLLLVTTAACGGAAQPAPAPETPKTLSASVPPPAPPPVAAEPAAAESTPTPPAPEPVAEKCDGGWVCVKVDFTTRKVEPRDTKLLGDPQIESTWSKTTDGRTQTFDQFSKGPVEITFRRLPGDKNDVIVKLARGGAPIVIDRHDGGVNDVTHVGAIATETKDGAMLIDLRYLR